MKKDGKVYCNKCGMYLGDYMEGDYFKLISMKYCPSCRIEVDRERKRLWQRARRAQAKKEKAEEETRLALLRRENQLLRDSIKRLLEK